MKMTDAILLETRANLKGWEITAETNRDDFFHTEQINMVDIENGYLVIITKRFKSKMAKRTTVTVSAFANGSSYRYPFHLVND